MKAKIVEAASDAELQRAFDAATKLLDDPAGILANIMASMGDGLSIQDRNFRIVYQNKAMIELAGPHIGEYCYKVYEKNDSVCQGCPIMEAYRTGQVSKSLRVGIMRNGTPFRFENIASVLRNEQGEIVAGVELCRNVEEREKAFDDLKEAMETLKQTQDQLIRAEKLAGIGQLAAGVAHEINNPTAFILSNLSTFRKYINKCFGHFDSIEKFLTSNSQEDSGGDKVREEMLQIVGSDNYRYLRDDMPEIIEESLDGLHRIKNIVTSLLSFATSSDDKRCSVDINAEIESSLALLDKEIVEKKGSVVKKLGSLSKTFANPRQFQQMFYDIILNASQAIDSGGVITIKTNMKDEHINIEISDDGTGIPENVLKNIFNPFFTTQEVGKGVGLGLSIAYRIVESHDGNIDVQSIPGQGTTITINLPISTA